MSAPTYGPPSKEELPNSLLNELPINPSEMLNYADQAIGASFSYMSQLGLTTAEIIPPSIVPVFPQGASAPALAISPPPTLAPITVSPPNMPSALGASISIDAYLPEAFDDNPPELVYGAAPSAPLDTLPDAPSVDTAYVMPELSVVLPSAPSLMTLTTHTYDGIVLPTVDENVPELIAIAPSVVPYQPGTGYSSILLSNLRDKLLDRLQNGGTGLNPDAESQIWDRERQREAIAYQDALDDLERMETLGYAFPPGIYMDARLKINTEMRARTISLGRDIMIKQAELELEGLNKSLDLAVGLESQLMNYTNSVEQRLFESCKYATEAGISIYNAKVQAYAAYLDAYKTKIDIYKAKIEAEMMKVEAYKAAIQGELAKAQVNTALVDQYRTQSEVALSAVEVFKARVDAIRSKAEIEKLKIEVFGEQVKAYTAKIGSYTAGVEGFRAMIQAEATKQDAYRSKVAAYSARVEAATKIADAKIEEYKGRIQAKVAEWEGYKAAFSGEAERAKALAASNSAIADAYKAEATANAAYNETLTKQWQVAIDQAQRVTEIGVAAAKSNADLYITARSLALDAAKVGAQVSAQISAAALNAINYSYSTSLGWSSSNSYNASDSFSNSFSNATSNVTSDQTSNIYQYVINA